jgi:predicted RNase H-like nuclease (RuvC/YqgF family)
MARKNDKLREEIENLKEIVEKLSNKINDLEKQIAEIKTRSVETQQQKKEAKEKRLEFKNKDVIVSAIGNRSSHVARPIDELQMTPNNIYTFFIECDEDFDILSLKNPFDEIFEVVSYSNEHLKLRPRVSYQLKDGQLIFVIR